MHEDLTNHRKQCYGAGFCQFALGNIPSLFWITFILHCDVWAVFYWFLFMDDVVFQRILLLFPKVLHGSQEHHLGKGNQLAENEPDVDHLDVRGGGQALHLADEDGGHH